MSDISRDVLDVEAIYSLDDFDQLKEVVSVLEKEVHDLIDERDQLSAKARRAQNLEDDDDDEEEVDIKSQILSERERLLKVHLEYLESAQPTDCSVNEAVSALMSDDAHAKVYRNLMIQTAWTEKRKSDEMKLIENLKVHIERDESIIDGIEEKTNELKAKAENKIVDSVTQRITKLRKKRDRAKSEVDKLQKAMSEFIEKHFPDPQPAYDAPATPESHISDSDFVSLNHIMERLIETYVGTPHDCYVNIERDWWPQHVEMLLRRGICVAHPKDNKKVRLEYYDT